MSRFILAFFLAAVSILVLRRFAPLTGLLDRPDERKQHHGVVPLVGGLGISFALATVSIAMDFDWTKRWYLAAGLLILLIVGAWDDRKTIGARPRFFIQCLVAFLIVIGEASTICQVGYPIWGDALGFELVSCAIAFFFIVGFVNAFNMIDGIDGLAGSVALTMSAAFLLATSGEMTAGDFRALLLTAIGAVCGFLIFNSQLPWRIRRYRVFMGDAGSMVLGLLIAWCTIRLAASPTATGELQEAGIAAWIVAYPVVDTVSVMLLRAMHGDALFKPDRRHLHHLLLDYGLSVNVALLVINGMVLIGIGAAMLGASAGLSDTVLVLGICALVIPRLGLDLWLTRQNSAAASFEESRHDSELTSSPP